MLKKSNLIKTIVLMAIATLCLAILQFYWIHASLIANRERFRQQVHEVLQTVSNKLEKQEAMQIANEKILNSINVEENYFLMNVDSLGNARWQQGRTIRLKQTLPPLKGGVPGYIVEEEAVINKSGTALKILSPGLEGSVPSIGGSRRSYASDSLRWYNRYSLQNQRNLARMSEIASIVVAEMLQGTRTLEEKVSKEEMDSLLRMELKRQGIAIPFEYAVKSMVGPGNWDMIYTNVIPSDHLLEAEFQVRLFPTDLFDDRNTLYVHFPGQDRFIISKMWAILLASLLLLGLVMYCFWYAIATIIRQKNISEITNDFISNMTHELKTPISTVSIACEALLDPDVRAMPNQQTRYLGIIRDENHRLSQQVERVLQIARLEKSDFKLKITRVDLHQLILHALENLTIQLEQRNGEVIKKLEAVNPVIEADEVHMMNIIVNLLDNAIKYSPNQLSISITTKNTENGIVCSFADEGQGIAKDMLDKIFDKFYRVPTGNVHNVKGFGLGLSYVKTMVEAHHGTIRVKSELQKGSVFTINLPQRHESN
jgi:two-component system phosphate regulon sensor histidine kinase PhoR